MKVEARTYASLSAPGEQAGEPREVELQEAGTVADLISALGIAAVDVHLVIVDGRISHRRDEPLRHGARVALFPPVGGG